MAGSTTAARLSADQTNHLLQPHMENQLERNRLDQPRHNIDTASYNTNLLKDFIYNSRVTAVGLVLSWLMFTLECLLAGAFVKISARVLVELGGNVPILVKEGQVYRLVLPLMLHAGALHILMNSLSLVGFCAAVEKNFSRKLYLAVYVLGGIQGNMMSTLYNLNFGNENIVGIGASTSICAVMGLYLANLLCLLKKGQDMHSDKQSAIRMVVSLLVISLLPGVDFFGHFGSLAGGLLLGLAVVPGEDKELVALKWAGMVLSAIYSLILLTIFI